MRLCEVIVYVHYAVAIQLFIWRIFVWKPYLFIYPFDHRLGVRQEKEVPSRMWEPHSKPNFSNSPRLSECKLQIVRLQIKFVRMTQTDTNYRTAWKIIDLIMQLDQYDKNVLELRNENCSKRWRNMHFLLRDLISG